MGDGYVVPSHFTAKSESLQLELEIEFVDGAPRVRRIELAGEHITGETLRRLQIGRLTRQAVAGAFLSAQRAEVDGQPALIIDQSRTEAAANAYNEYVQDARRPRSGAPLTDDDLQNVADLYRAALADGRPPTQTIANEMHASRATAARWVARARERGLLGAAIPGRAGEKEAH